MPQVSPATIVLLLLALLGGAWAAGLLRPQYEGGRLTIRILRADRALLAIDFRHFPPIVPKMEKAPVGALSQRVVRQVP